MNSPAAPKDIIKYPENTQKKKMVEQLTSLEEYKTAKTFRIQVLILLEFSRYSYNGQFKLTYQDVADLFDVTVPIIKRAYSNGKKDVDGVSKPNGRPFTLNKDQLQSFCDWYNQQNEPPKYEQVKNFFANEAGQFLEYRTYKNAVSKAGLKVESAEAIDEDRYYCSPNSIENYYHQLEGFFITYNIPSCFVFNVDEEGHDEYVDSPKNELVVVPKDNSDKLFYPVERKSDHTTFVACIAADGTFMKPLIVVKRKTIEARAIRLGLWTKVKVKYQETGYINSEVFDDWVEQIFIPDVNERRRTYNYSGPAVLILDGCPSHFTKKFFDLCNANNIKIFFIPPHSSNQTQMLDLVTFHSHKANVRKARLFEIDDDNVLIDKIVMLLDSFQRSATFLNIRSSFEAAGAVYDLLDNYVLPIIRFSIDFTTQIWHCSRTKEEKAEIREKRKGKGETETRIGLKDFNDLNVYWENKNVSKAVAKLPKIMDYNELLKTSLNYRLLCATIPLEQIFNNIEEEKEERSIIGN